MESTLSFVSSQSVALFKASKMIDKISIRENEITKAKSFVFAGGNGTVSKTWDKSKESVVSVVRDDAGAEFLMIHNTVTTNVVDEL